MATGATTNEWEFQGAAISWVNDFLREHALAFDQATQEFRNADGKRSEEDLLLLAADAGAEDLRTEDGEIVIECPPEALEAVIEALGTAKVPISSAEVTLVPANTVMIEDRDIAKKLVKLMNTLDDLDDVQNVTANFDLPEALMAELAHA